MADRTYHEDIWVSSNEINFNFFFLKKESERTWVFPCSLVIYLVQIFKKSNIIIYITLIFIEEMLLFCFIKWGNKTTESKWLLLRNEEKFSRAEYSRIHCDITGRSEQYWRELWLSCPKRICILPSPFTTLVHLRVFAPVT